MAKGPSDNFKMSGSWATLGSMFGRFDWPPPTRSEVPCDEKKTREPVAPAA